MFHRVCLFWHLSYRVIYLDLPSISPILSSALSILLFSPLISILYFIYSSLYSYKFYLDISRYFTYRFAVTLFLWLSYSVQFLILMFPQRMNSLGRITWWEEPVFLWGEKKSPLEATFFHWISSLKTDWEFLKATLIPWN